MFAFRSYLAAMALAPVLTASPARDVAGTRVVGNRVGTSSAHVLGRLVEVTFLTHTNDEDKDEDTCISAKVTLGNRVIALVDEAQCYDYDPRHPGRFKIGIYGRV